MAPKFNLRTAGHNININTITAQGDINVPSM